MTLPKRVILEKREMMSGRICDACGGPIGVKVASQQKVGKKRYCSRECRRNSIRLSYRVAHTAQNLGNGICNSTSGAMGELIVAADLMRKHYNVFRALSPASICDLVIVAGKNVHRVEVTTGSMSASGKLKFIKHDPKRYDTIAVIVDKEIIYVGDLPRILETQ